MKYNSFRYIYPPRPRNPITSDELNSWDNNSLIGQLKLNGSNCVIFTNGIDAMIMNRHSQRLTNFTISLNEVLSLHRGDKNTWMVINGEYLNKSKNDEGLVPFNHKLIIFDILVYNSDYLVGKTFEDRIKLLDQVYDVKDSEKSYLYSISNNVYRVKSFDTNFLNLFNEFSKIDMVEGLVLKRKNAKLEIGNTVNNNIKSQLKCRKATKLYKY
jgi:hypothetical protein